MNDSIQDNTDTKITAINAQFAFIAQSFIDSIALGGFPALAMGNINNNGKYPDIYEQAKVVYPFNRFKNPYYEKLSSLYANDLYTRTIISPSDYESDASNAIKDGIVFGVENNSSNVFIGPSILKTIIKDGKIQTREDITFTKISEQGSIADLDFKNYIVVIFVLYFIEVDKINLNIKLYNRIIILSEPNPDDLTQSYLWKALTNSSNVKNILNECSSFIVGDVNNVFYKEKTL